VQDLQVLLDRITRGDAKRREATLVADIRRFLLEAPLDLHADDLPTQDGRIDVEVGSVIIEVRRDLRARRVFDDAVAQLAEALQVRERELERRFAGLMTDGRQWICFTSAVDGLHEVTRVEIEPRNPAVEPFLNWLDGVLATSRDREVTPREIEQRLGYGSSAHALDRAGLVDLHARHRNEPGVRMKRALWARLLMTALGTRFEDDDELFIAHTLLVNAAQIIAQAVAGRSPIDAGPAGAMLSEHGSPDVIEPAGFEWVAEVPGGEAFKRTLARRLGRFAWATVEHDVLKVLYESVIPSTSRKQLGEYYTPDWLAEKLVADTIDDPLHQRVLDPACGSGTFLFHAVRRHLDAATAAGQNLNDSLVGVTSHVFGVDLHPVAVALARVTYLLALGRERLTHVRRTAVHIPVYLGDSMRWQQQSLESLTPGDMVPQGRVDVLIGNPPWLAYRHMPKALQAQFRKLSEVRGLWQGAKVATHQDLSALFAARSIQLYLRVGGKFAFVLPNAALDRSQFSGFRSGRFDDAAEIVHVAFSRPWDLRRLRPHFFPRGSAVVFGRRAKRSKPMPSEAEVWTGRISKGVESWAVLERDLEREVAPLTIIDETSESPYQEWFRQGATFVPRILFLIERRDPGALGMPQGRALIRSTRTALEKLPWRDLPPLEGSVETEFIMPVYMGEHVLPHRLLPPTEGVVPWDQGQRRLLRPTDDPRLDSYPLLAKWWRRAGTVWNEHRSSERLSIVEQLDYHGKLVAQYPIRPLRVVYAASGMHLCAARIEHHRAVISHSLYWSWVDSVDEARYLCAILNATCVTELVRPYMSYGKDERHIDKHVWKLPIPKFDPSNRDHMKLAKQAAHVETAVAALELDDDLHFAARRRRIREFLVDHPIAQQIEKSVAKLLGQ
jgi:SAM-dependent methyltransferase